MLHLAVCFGPESLQLLHQSRILLLQILQLLPLPLHPTYIDYIVCSRVSKLCYRHFFMNDVRYICTMFWVLNINDLMNMLYNHITHILRSTL